MYLQHNYIDLIGDGFELTMNLRLLFLQGNRIRHIERESLFHLKRLELLDLSDNFIEDCGRYGRDTFPPHSLSILDLKNNPVSEQPKHRNSAVSSLPRLTILDGSKVTREDGENEATRMFVMIPMLEDDGTEAGEMMLNFDRDSDLWVVADTFCNVNEIEGDGARRELVTMMKREARRVWGTIVMDKEVTLKKMVETMDLDDDDEDDEEKRQEEKQETKVETDEHEAAVRMNTERAFTAVEAFLTEMEEEPSSKLTEKRAALTDASGARKQKDIEVSKEALDEAQRLLKEKVAMIQREKEEQRRKTKELKASAKKTFIPPPVPEESKYDESKDEAKEEEAKGEDVVPGPRPPGPLLLKKMRADSFEDEDDEDAENELRFENAILTAST